MSVTDILIALVPALGLGFQVICMQLIGGKYTNKVMGMAIVTLIFRLLPIWKELTW